VRQFGKNLSVEKGEQVLFDDIRYFFYIPMTSPPPQTNWCRWPTAV